MTIVVQPPALEVAHLQVTGMSCAACAARIEKKLNALPGVTASVNYATEGAAVRFDPSTMDSASLVNTVVSLGYGATVPSDLETIDSAVASARNHELGRLVGSAALGLPVVMLSMIPGLQFDRWQWVALVLATPVVFWGGWPFHRAAMKNLRQRATTMDTLVSIGTLAAYFWSVYALVFGNAGMIGMHMSFDWALRRDGSAHHLYLEVAAAVVVFLLAGRYLESRAKRDAGAALRTLLSLGAKHASVVQPDGTELSVPAAALLVGDRIVVRPGEKIATDGEVEVGESSVDQALVTGESLPVHVGPGALVIGATVNLDGRLIVRATRVGADTALAQMARLVTDAQSGKAPIQRLADRVAAVFVPAVMAIAAMTFVGWLIADGNSRQAFTAAIAVLIIACPCALGLATPTALLVGTGRGAQLGIVIRGPEVLESTRRVDTVVLDKTGTITTGRMSVVDYTTAKGHDPDEVLKLVGAVEALSEHPIGRAITAAAHVGTQNSSPLNSSPLRRGTNVEQFMNYPGQGVSAIVDGRLVRAGRPEWLQTQGVAGWESLEREGLDQADGGLTRIVASVDGQVAALFMLADTAKPTSRDAIQRLRSLGLRPVLLTGDQESVARRVASEVGIPDDDVVARVLPADKVAVIRRLQGEGRVVAMVGDGVNDAAALAQADLGIAMGTGTDAAIEAADLTLVTGDLLSAADAIRLSRRTLSTIKANLGWAFGYNVAAIPLAALGYLNPLIAGAAMAASSVLVVTNSLRLRNFR
jgi:P-type Cu+ transporter